ncbi:UNVERIFIED_CONTAM: hypothetical protein Cloal_3482 [Acetivibrio alkalicellulosi]
MVPCVVLNINTPIHLIGVHLDLNGSQVPDPQGVNIMYMCNSDFIKEYKGLAEDTFIKCTQIYIKFCIYKPHTILLKKFVFLANFLEDIVPLFIAAELNYYDCSFRCDMI